jgi:hypothetical protein
MAEVVAEVVSAAVGMAAVAVAIPKAAGAVRIISRIISRIIRRRSSNMAEGAVAVVAPGSSSNRLFCRATVAGRSRSNSRQSSSTGRSRSNSQSSTSRSSSRPAMDEVAVVGKVAAVGDSN